ncbi:ketopantoate reductase family protein, partial [Spirosoma flavum]
MKILMVGRGVIAAQYGWAFEKAGHTVEFYVRPGRAATLGSTLPLHLLDARTKTKGVLVNERWPVQLRESIPVGHTYDLIVVSVQHYQFGEVAAFLAPLISNTTVLIFNNFWQDPQEQASALPAEQLVWGFPQAGGGFDANGVLTGALFADVHFGTFGTDPTPRDLAIRDLFATSGFKLHEHRDFRGWLWIHFAVDAGFFAEVLRVGSVEGVFH